MHNGFLPSRRAWNRVMTVLVWAAALLVMALVAGILGMVLVRGVPHISWNFLTTTASVLKGTGCILAVGRIVGESAALLFTAGAAEVIAKGVVKAYTSNGATLSVLLYLRAFEDGDFASAWGIGAVLLVLVLAINLAARLAKAKLKQKQ